MVTGLLLGIGPPAAVLITLAVRAYLRSGSLVESWAAERELRLTDESRPMVAWYLRTSRSLRLIGVLGGIILAPLTALAIGTRGGPGLYVWPAAVAGYLVGILYAEVALLRPASGRASIRPRDVREYLSPWARRLQCRTAVLMLLVAVAAVIAPMRDSFAASLLGRLGLLAVLVAVAVGIEAAQRWLVRRPQPVASDALLAADDAIRRQSVHSIAGAGIGLMYLLGAVAMMTLALSDVQVLRWTAWIAALVMCAIGLAACTRYESGVLQIRRPVET